MANILIGLFLPKIESDNGYSCVISRHISSSSHFVNSRESTKCDRPIFKITGLSELKPAAKREVQNRSDQSADTKKMFKNHFIISEIFEK